MNSTPRTVAVPASRIESAPARRWLLLVHQLPASPSNLRVRTWRRLQQLGALPVKQTVYVLPDSPTAREDFEWLRVEIQGAGGEVSLFSAETVDAWTHDALVDAFRRARQDGYQALASEIERASVQAGRTRRRRGARHPSDARLGEAFRARLAALEAIDFFGSAGRDRVVTLLGRFDEQTQAAAGGARAGESGDTVDRSTYVGRLWVTRPRPGVDRMSSAWLIRRFIDPGARFDFAPDRKTLPSPDAVPFDMFGVDFSHHDDACTFETLCARFGIDDAAVRRVAAIVHDLDLKDDRFGAPEAATVGTLIDGLQLSTTDDHLLLEHGMTLFESLYLTFAGAARLNGPRRVASPSALPKRRGRR